MKIDGLLSETGRALRPIAIRKYRPYIHQPGILSFAGGWPAAEMFPIETIAALSQEVILEEGDTALQYGPTQGHPDLLEALTTRSMAVFDRSLTIDNLMILAGAQQGIFLSAMALLDPGDGVIVEAPTFSGALSVFNNFRANIVPIPMDEEGLQTEALAAYLAAGGLIKLVYAIPDFQNPTGRTMSLERRQALVDLAARYDFLILEDSPYRELRYEGEDLPSLFSLDNAGRVLFLGSFSKIFAPLRLGWMVADPDIIGRMIIARQGVDLCSPALTQAVVARFLKKGFLEKHIGALRRYYRHKRDVMLAGLDRESPPGIDWTAPAGGMFVWVTLPRGSDTDALFFEAVQQRVAFVPGSAFYPDERPCREFRLNFASATAGQIEEGMGILGRYLTGIFASP